MKKSGLFITLIFIFSFFYYGCGCRTCNDDFVSDITDSILQRGNQFLIDQVGEKYFRSYMRIDYAESKFDEPYYRMVYRFFIPEKPYVNVYIKFSLDADGKIVESEDIIGVPRCLASPEDCEFGIDKETVKQIAAKNSFEEGVNDWIVAFRWHKEMGIYIWHLLNTLADNDSVSSGKEMMIDPNSGEIYEINEWSMKK